MYNKKIPGALILASLLLVLSATLVSAATFILLETGPGNIDGIPSEWGTLNQSNPYYITDLCLNGDCANQLHVARLFGHYACQNSQFYFIVAANTGLSNTVSATNNFLAQDTPSNIVMFGGAPYTTNTNQNNSIWRYLTTGGSGFEAAYPITSASVITLYVQAYINSTPGGAPEIASTGINRFITSGCGTTAVTLSSFNAQAGAESSNLILGLVGIVSMIAITGTGIVLWRRMV